MWIPSLHKSANYAEVPPLAAGRRQAPGVGGDGILVVTADERFFYSLFAVSLDIGGDIGRGIRWAHTVEGAWRELCSSPAPVVVYDQRLPWADWRDELRSLSTLPGSPLVVLAAQDVDEDLWRTVLRCHGYDAVERSAPGNDWMRALCFALHRAATKSRPT